jgi:hypothetical protein
MSARTQRLVDVGFSARRADALEADFGAANDITFTPAGSIAATTVQAAIEEVDGDVTAHVGDTSGVHDASAISFSPAGNIAATTVQAAVEELDSEKQAAATARTQGKTTLWVPATVMTPGAGPPTLTTVSLAGNAYTGLAFDPSSFESAFFQVGMPKGWNEGTITFIAYWAHPATVTSFGVVWQLAAGAASNDDTLDFAAPTAVSVTDAGGTTNDLYIADESSALTISNTPAENDLVCFRIGRDATNGSDTLAVDAYLIGIKILYTTNAGNDA